MKLISSRTEITHKDTHEVEYNGEEYTFIWFVKTNNSESILQTVLRDKNGKDVNNPLILEEMEKFVLEQTE